MLAAARTVLGPTDADLDDVLQDGLCALRRAIASFRGDSSFLHFARRIAVKQALMVRRRRGVHQRAVAALTLSEEPADEPTAGGGERRQALRELLDQLRPEQAEALVLYSVLDLSLDEVAAASDCPRNTVRSRLRLAKDHVRQLLRDQPLLASKLGVEP
jgi:RNA polymerase sigma-70 factor (ECF subfamily)